MGQCWSVVTDEGRAIEIVIAHREDAPVEGKPSSTLSDRAILAIGM